MKGLLRYYCRGFANVTVTELSPELALYGGDASVDPHSINPAKHDGFKENWLGRLGQVDVGPEPRYSPLTIFNESIYINLPAGITVYGPVKIKCYKNQL